jgi:hypothetical protein
MSSRLDACDSPGPVPYVLFIMNKRNHFLRWKQVGRAYGKGASHQPIEWKMQAHYRI